jgi:membrane protein involved in colicin uptake
MTPDEISTKLEGLGKTPEEIDDFLEHFGVRGMKWGVRKNRLANVSAKTNREAKKDAEEFARAKLFYGKGAGTRRKLIKATVDAKIAKDPNYARAYSAHLAKQDSSKHAEKARSERASIDRRDKTKKSAGFLARRFTGEMGTQAAFTAIGRAGAAYFSNPNNRAKAGAKLNTVKNYLKNQNNTRKITDFLNKNGFG